MMPRKSASLPNGQLDGHGVRLQALVDHVDHVVEVRAHDVHLVDVDDARDVVVVGLAPDGLALGLDAALAHSTVTLPSSTRRLRSTSTVKSTWPGGVDDVQTAAAPVAGGGRGGDGYASLLLLLHPVHGRGALVRLAYLVVDAVVERECARSWWSCPASMWAIMPMFLVFSSEYSLGIKSYAPKLRLNLPT